MLEKLASEKRSNTYMVLGMAGVLALVAIVFYFFTRPAPLIAVDISGDPFMGNPNASVLIVEFSDFECPVCAEVAYPELKRFVADYSDRVKFVYKNYPLDMSCNKEMSSQLHPHSCIAAEAAECAFEQGKFWEYHDLLFENYGALTLADLIGYAKGVGLDMNRFNDCLTTRRQAAAVRADLEEGDRIMIQGTPTFIINGRAREGVPSYEELKKMVEEQLKA